MEPLSKEFLKDSETRYKILESMKALEKELEKEGYAVYAKKISKIITEFRVKYGSDLII